MTKNIHLYKKLEKVKSKIFATCLAVAEKKWSDLDFGDTGSLPFLLSV